MPNNHLRFAVLLVLAVACSAPTAPEPEGTWGGTEASLTLSRSGGTLGYPCGAGSIDSSWSIDSGGRFTATGQHYFGGGPVPITGRPPHQARYTGRVDRDEFTLTVTLVDLSQVLGPFHMTRGGPAVSEICL